MVDFAGILGVHHNEDSNEMLRMLKVMSLPNDCALYERFFPRAHLGQTHQPFLHDSDSTFCLSLRGEIYNWQDLRLELTQSGQHLENDSQAHLILTAYQTWGPKFLSKLDGRFVLFIYHIKERKLLIGRDKLGSERLYWGRFSNIFLFSTSLKGLLTSHYVPQNPCLESLAAYLHLGYFPQDKTPIVNVNCLLPGYYLFLDSDMNIVLNKYWSFKDPFQNEKFLTQEQVNHKFDELFSKAVLKRCQSKEAITCYYQGDLGSAALPLYFNKLGLESQVHFVNEFQGQKTSYLPFVEHLSKAFHFDLQKSSLGSEKLFDNLERLVWHLDEPIADPTSLLIWDLANNLKGKSHHVICSLGFSEFLGASYAHDSLSYDPLFLWFIQLLRPLVNRFGIPILAKMNKRLAFKALRYYQKDFWASEYIRQKSLFTPNELKKIAPELYSQFDFDIYIHQTYQYLKYIHLQNFDISDYFFYDAETALCNDQLVQYNNILKGFDLQLHCPFLDEDLSLFLIHTPEKFKSRRKCSALPLHDSLKKYLEPSFLHYDYQRSPGFLNHLLQLDRVRLILEKLSKGSLCESGIISAKGLKEQLYQTPSTPRQFQRLWSLLILEVWFQLFINRPQYKYPEAGHFGGLTQLL